MYYKHEYYFYGENDYWIWDFTDNKNFGSYIFTCTICNNFPILPKCLGDSELVTYNFTGANITESSSKMSLFLGMLSVILVYLA